MPFTPYKVMFRTLILSSIMLFISNVSAQNAEEELAQYSVGVGVGPFGGSLGFLYHFDAKTTLQVSLGGLPESDSPLALSLNGVEYDVAGASSWVGFFLNHRPIENAEWFRVNAGLGVGSIQNSIVNPNTLAAYSADYRENPVAYLGIGAGLRAKKGIQLGFDLGWLQTNGPEYSIDDVGSADASDFRDVRESGHFTTALPNIQFSFGYGF